jgi:hypothetical protein
MANKSAQIAASKTSALLERVAKVPLESAAGTVPQGGLIGRNAAGYFVNADDTAKLREIGLNIGVTQLVNSANADGTQETTIERGVVVAMKIATLTSLANARLFLGAPVFALYNDEVSLSPGTYANQVGKIIGINSVTEVMVYVEPEESVFEGRKVGSSTTPETWTGADEWEEILVAANIAALTKPLIRTKVSTSIDMTSGLLSAHYISATAGDGLDAAHIRALWVGAGMKGSAGVALATTDTGVPHCCAYMKMEDDYATNGQAVGGPTWTGAVANLVLAAQLSSSPTGHFCAIELDCQSAVNGTPNAWDSIFHVLTGGQNGSIANVFQFDGTATCVVVGSGTYSTADGYLIIKVGANTYRMPFFTAVD